MRADADEPEGAFALPMLLQQTDCAPANVVGVVCWRAQCGLTGDRGEIGVAQLQHDGARSKSFLLPVARTSFAHLLQHLFKLFGIARIALEGVFLAD